MKENNKNSRMKKKKLTSDLTLYFNKNFPAVYSTKSGKRYTVYLGLGGNIGDVFKRFDNLLKRFKYDTNILLIETSLLLENPPFGYLEQDYFLNGVVKIGTNMPPYYLLKSMQKYEKRFARVRTFQDAPRTLDIDIIFIQINGRNIQINKKDLIVPHAGWKYRDSVKIPLKYMKSNIKSKDKVYSNERK
jgi:2-amino-4-hydroxy-6-hydroxymethyldihydropteridine diphosphokinase